MEMERRVCGMPPMALPLASFHLAKETPLVTQFLRPNGSVPAALRDKYGWYWVALDGCGSQEYYSFPIFFLITL